jgi:hypothetical protein
LKPLPLARGAAVFHFLERENPKNGSTIRQRAGRQLTSMPLSFVQRQGDLGSVALERTWQTRVHDQRFSAALTT